MNPQGIVSGQCEISRPGKPSQPATSLVYAIEPMPIRTRNKHRRLACPPAIATAACHGKPPIGTQDLTRRTQSFTESQQLALRAGVNRSTHHLREATTKTAQ